MEADEAENSGVASFNGGALVQHECFTASFAESMFGALTGPGAIVECCERIADRRNIWHTGSTKSYMQSKCLWYMIVWYAKRSGSPLVASRNGWL